METADIEMFKGREKKDPFDRGGFILSNFFLTNDDDKCCF